MCYGSPPAARIAIQPAGSCLFPALIVGSPPVDFAVTPKRGGGIF
jgi:hypothetical protein